LLCVSGCRPHQLTHRFIVNNTPHSHLAPWLDEDLAAGQSHRLYRFLGSVDVPPRGSGVSLRGRIPGEINLNTVFDFETFAALCDRSPSNLFNDTASAMAAGPPAVDDVM